MLVHMSCIGLLLLATLTLLPHFPPFNRHVCLGLGFSSWNGAGITPSSLHVLLRARVAVRWLLPLTRGQRRLPCVVWISSLLLLRLPRCCEGMHCMWLQACRALSPIKPMKPIWPLTDHLHVSFIKPMRMKPIHPGAFMFHMHEKP